METAKQSSTNIAIKWALIYIAVSIILTYAYQFLNIDQASPARYISYLPFIAFLILTQKEFRDLKSGFMTFGEGFIAGLLYSVFAGVLLAVFTFIYLSFLNPHFMEQAMAAQQAKMAEQGLSAEQTEKAMEIGTKYGGIIACVSILIGTPVMGAIISLIGAAIFKKERTLFDIEQAEGNKPFHDKAV